MANVIREGKELKRLNKELEKINKELKKLEHIDNKLMNKLIKRAEKGK
ncbi:hypothetical protein GF374_02445 [Candidatus Woesearchaeota archaeon]|nr:hypothetical protein [Candidatus Woesearchaeota archaeon]